jgi:hypothetical protein
MSENRLRRRLECKREAFWFIQSEYVLALLVSYKPDTRGLKEKSSLFIEYHNVQGLGRVFGKDFMERRMVHLTYELGILHSSREISITFARVLLEVIKNEGICDSRKGFSLNDTMV